MDFPDSIVSRGRLCPKGGRGGSTTYLQDLQNSDCVIIQGSNFAEAHPVGFRWVMEAKARGATVIHVDPRFSRTSPLAAIFVPTRAGTDIAFLALLAGSAATRYSVFYAGVESTRDPRYVVRPQRERLSRDD